MVKLNDARRMSHQCNILTPVEIVHNNPWFSLLLKHLNNLFCCDDTRGTIEYDDK